MNAVAVRERQNQKREQPKLVVLVDTREQRPWVFPADVEVRVATLCTGDYSALGVEHLIRIERKSLIDFLGCVGNSRARFEREMQRMREFHGRYLVLEFTPQQLVETPAPYSKVHPASAMGSLWAWSYRFGIQPVFAGDRRYAAAIARKLLERAVIEREREVGA